MWCNIPCECACRVSGWMFMDRLLSLWGGCGLTGMLWSETSWAVWYLGFRLFWEPWSIKGLGVSSGMETTDDNGPAKREKEALLCILLSYIHDKVFHRSYCTNATSTSCMRIRTAISLPLPSNISKHWSMSLFLGLVGEIKAVRKLPKFQLGNPPRRSMLMSEGCNYFFPYDSSTAQPALASKLCLLNWTEFRALTKIFWKHHSNKVYLFILWGTFYKLVEDKVSYRISFIAARIITGFMLYSHGNNSNTKLKCKDYH